MARRPAKRSAPRAGASQRRGARTCEVCGNEYDKVFRVVMPEGHASPGEHVFDSFECAVHALAPTCAHCGCPVIGHGVEADGTIFCCAHCAHVSGIEEVQDRAV